MGPYSKLQALMSSFSEYRPVKSASARKSLQFQQMGSWNWRMSA